MRANRSAAVPLFLLVPFFAAHGAQANRIHSEVDPSQRVMLAHTVSSRLGGAKDLGMADPNFRLDSLVLLLKPSTQQKRKLEQLLEDLQNPGSPNYHRWLTPQEYAERFGLSNADIEKVRGWLESQGFQIDRVANARNWIMFSGTHSQTAEAFHTEIHRFQIGRAGVFSQHHGCSSAWVKLPYALAQQSAATVCLTS